MGGGNTKEKPKEKEKKDQARTLKAIQNAIETGATRLDLNNRHIRELPDSFEGKKEALKWLSMSHNEMRTLSDGVCQFVNLSALRLNGNQLSSLPDSISALSGLQVLDLSKNRFTQWDPHINSMPLLTDLNLQCNQIASLPEEFGSLSALKYLNLYINHISNFDVKWSLLSNLTSLDLSYNGLTDASLTSSFVLPSLVILPLCGNKLTSIPEPILSLPLLRCLDLRFNQLEVLPDDLGALAAQLRILRLSNNNLKSLPPSFSQLVNLEDLDLSSNQLVDLENVQGLTKLTALHVYWNKVTSLPEDIGNLVELRELYLIDNDIRSLPESMSRMVNLKTFMVHYNDCKDVPSSIFSGWTTLNVLHLGGNNMVTLPSEINSVTNLTRLDIRANLLATLPSSLSDLKSLMALDAGDNNLLVVPPVISEIKSLTSLNLFSNGLSVLPASIGSLPTLTSLNISFNQLAILPPEFTSLISLVHLRAEGNFFKEFPDPILALTALKELAIGSNRKIKELPHTISQLASLTTFQASSNQISALPDSFVLLKNLTELDLSHNRLLMLPVDLDNLSALTDLDISGNALTRIPQCFGNMRALQQVKASFNPGLTDVPVEYFKSTETTAWISCTGNSKIESEFYFARKKPSEKATVGRWQPTAEEDFAPVDASNSIHHASLVGHHQSTPHDDIPSGHSPALASPLASHSPHASSPLTDHPAITPDPVVNDGTSTPPPSTPDHPSSPTPQLSGNSATPSPSPSSTDLSAKSDPSANGGSSTATPSSPTISPANNSNSQPSHPDGSETPEDKRTRKGSIASSSTPSASPKDKKHKLKGTSGTGSSTSIDFHTSSPYVDDRRLTLIPSDEPSPDFSQEMAKNSASSSSANAVDNKKDKSGKDKDKKKEAEDRKREKEMIASTVVDSNLVTRTPQIGWAEMRGARPDMQDSLILMENFLNSTELTLLGLFDGHGGTESALLVAKKAPILTYEAIRHVMEARGLDVTSASLRMLPTSDLAIIIRSTFMSLHGSVAKAGYTDGTAATIALVLHQYGTTPKTPTPPKEQWSSNNLNAIYGDEEYPEGPIATWSEKGKAAQLLLTSPPTSAAAVQAQLSASTVSETSDAEAQGQTASGSRPETPAPPGSELSVSSASSSSKKKKTTKNLASSSSQIGSRSLLILGNCGDQRAVLCRKGQAFPLTKDHKPENPSELARIAKSGGFVAETRRVNGLLALSRAIGDVAVQPAVTFEPDIMVVELTEHDEFLIIACDGVWDVLSSEQAVYLTLAESSPARAANRIREYAFSLGSTDNISVVIYQLKPRDRTNFGTSLMTHVAENQALQAAVPRFPLNSSNNNLASPPQDLAVETIPEEAEEADGASSAPTNSSPMGDSFSPVQAKNRKKAKSHLELSRTSLNTDKDAEKTEKAE